MWKIDKNSTFAKYKLVMHLIQTGWYTLSSPHNELLRTQPDSMKKAGEAEGGVFGGAVVAVVDNEGRYESHQG